MRFRTLSMALAPIAIVLIAATALVVDEPSAAAGMRVDRAPVVIGSPINISIHVGYKFHFAAKVEGSPKPTVHWEVSTDGVSFVPVPGATHAILTLTATPNMDGDEYEAIFSNRAGEATSSPATLTVLEGGPFTIYPTTLRFGSAAVGEISPVQTLSITNNSGSTLPPNEIGVGGARFFSAATLCGGAGLLNGQSCDVSYAFAPEKVGLLKGRTMISVDGENVRIRLIGTGLPSGCSSSNLFSLAPTTLNFGSVPVGSTSALQTMVITNICGHTLDNVVLTSGAGPNIGGGGNNCGALLNGQSCDVYYDFSPTKPGAVEIKTIFYVTGEAFDLTFTGIGV